MIDIQGIKEALPHRYPMLLVDRVLEVSEDTIVAIKNVTINEPFFNGHFPQYPVMPLPWLKQRLKWMVSLQPVVLLPLQLETKEVLHVSKNFNCQSW